VDNKATSTPTDIGEFITDLDAGLFERKLSAALSMTAAAVVDRDRVGEVSVSFKLKKIPGTCQVHVEHQIKFSRPTEHGKVSEEDTRTTPMHVGKYGKLSLAPENQMSFMDRQGQVTA
jgi:hypothetical protein